MTIKKRKKRFFRSDSGGKLVCSNCGNQLTLEQLVQSTIQQRTTRKVFCSVKCSKEWGRKR